MSTTIYDKALAEKFKKWTTKTKVNLISPEETRKMLEMIADANNDKPIKLPLICIRRNGDYRIDSTAIGKRPLNYDGLTLEANNDKSMQLNAIPIIIPYEIDVMTRYFKEADEYMRNIIFNIINSPKFEVEIPYQNIDKMHNADITITTDVGNGSATSERQTVGQFTVLTLGIEVKNAYLFDVRVRDNLSIDFSVDTVDDN